MSGRGLFDAFIADCERDCVGPAAPEPESETSEPQHAHTCPACGDSWLHASVDCEVVYPASTWMRCPFCEGRAE